MAVMLSKFLNAVAYPEFGREEPILGIDLLGLPFEISWLLSWTSNFGAGQQLCRAYLCGLKAIQARHPSLAAVKRCVRTMQDQYFSPFLLFARGSITELEPLVEQSFQEIIQAYAAMHLEASHST